MCRIKIDDLPQAVKNKNLTKQEAVKIIWEELYTKPEKYGLLHLTEDQKSEFLLNTHKKFEHFLEKFIPGTVSFRTYLSACLINYKNNFLRKQSARSTEMKCLSSYLASKSEEEKNRYLTEPEIIEEKIEKIHRKSFSDITEQQVATHRQRSKRIAEITALVLLMKACSDIDDESIESVCNFTEIDKSLLYETIQKLKESMSRKDELQQKIVTRRNNAFFFHRKYMQEMLLPQSQENKLRILRERYEKQTKKWKDKNDTLSIRSNTPSNEEIAKALGIKPRMVSFYINHVRNAKNREEMKKMLTGQENYEEEEKNDNSDEIKAE